MSYIPAKNAYSRVFLIERRARGDREPDYHSSLIAGAVEQSFGDIEKIEIPDPDKYGEFEEIGTIRGGEERATTSLSGRYAADLASDLLRLAKIKCASDLQVHFGACQDPNSFNEFDKALILENASLTSVSTEELGTLESGNQAAVNESAEISASNWYEVLPVKLAERGGSVVANEVVDVALSDTIGCGECEDESDGCQKIYAVSLTAPGSPGTPSDLLYSPDNGVTWYVTDVDGLGANDADAVAKVGNYVVVVSNAGAGHFYVLQSEMALLVNGTGDPAFASVTSGYNGSGPPNDIWSVGVLAFIVGDAGYIYSLTSDATASPSTLDAGSAVTDNLNAVHAMSKTQVLAGGDAGAVVYSLDGESFTEVAVRPTAQNINAVWMKSERYFWVGTADGRLFYTIDQGASWTEKTFSGSGAGVVYDITFATDSVMFVAHATAAPAGRILRSYDGGYSFNILPEGVGSIPDNDRITALAACGEDANFIVGVGATVAGGDGIIVRGID
jgi:photosystem II stability/assembly factor-like uncharacterized protein